MPLIVEKMKELGIKALEPYVDEFSKHPTHLPPGAGLLRFILDEFKDGAMDMIVVSWFTAEGGF